MNPAIGGHREPGWTPDLTPGAAIEVLGQVQGQLYELKVLVRAAPAVPDEDLLDRIAHRAHQISLATEARFLSIAKKAREVAWVADEIVVGYGGSDMAQLRRRMIVLEDHLRRAMSDAIDRFGRPAG